MSNNQLSTCKLGYSALIIELIQLTSKSPKLKDKKQMGRNKNRRLYTIARERLVSIIGGSLWNKQSI